MRQLVECVPNISEGRNRAVIDAIVSVVDEVEGVRLLDVDPGAETHRTVITLLGPPEPVGEAAFRLVAKAAKLIDMSRHSGAHPRHGATDVCPFVPVRGISMEEVVELARKVGKRIGEELGIPVYLYESAALREERRNLAHCRQGEYEALREKLGKPEWKPDFGPASFGPEVARTGATNVGARHFLVAYNVNLNSRSRAIAHDIALDVREAGRSLRDADGKLVRDDEGKRIPDPGTLEAVKAIGWTIPEFDRAQLSMNLVDTSITKPHEAFEEVRRQARKRNVRVTGSELVGLVPEGDLLAAGKHYLRASGESAGIPRKMLVESAIQSLGLRDLGSFEPQEKVLEYKAGLDDGRLVSMSGREFADELSTDSPAPGGGSVAALSAAHAAALVAMVANLTVGKKGYDVVQERVKQVAEEAQELKDFFLSAVDEDTAAFDEVMAAFRLPRKSDEDKERRGLAIAAATRGAIRVPLSVLERAPELIALADEMAQAGNESSRSDAAVGILEARAAAEGTYFNVLINLVALADTDTSEAPGFGEESRKRAVEAMARVEEIAEAARRRVREMLEAALG